MIAAEESSHTSNAPVQTRAIPPQVIEQLAASLPINDKNDLGEYEQKFGEKNICW